MSASPSAQRPAPAARDRGLAAYRLLMVAYPPDFRAAYGREMAQLFRDQRRVAGLSRRPALGFWAAVVWDVARSAPALRLDALRAWWRARHPGSRTGGGPNLQSDGGTMLARRTVAALATLGGLFELANTGAEVWAGYAGVMLGWAVAMVLSVVMGALLLASGVALLRGGTGGARVARGTALACLALVIGLQLTWPFMSIFSRLLGVVLPLALLVVLRRGRGPSAPAVA